MKKCLKVGAFLLAMALLSGLIYLTNTLTGYPVSYFVVKHSLDTYMAEHYADTDFVAGKPEHSLKLGGFTVEVTSPGSPDTSFWIQFNNDGCLVDDSYDTNVKSGYNTALRLSRQYNKLCETVFDSRNFPFDAVCGGSFESAIYGSNKDLEEPGTCPEPWNIQELKPDADYAISSLSGQYGTVTLTVTTDAVTLETAETSLLELRRIMEAANIPFCSVELWILSADLDAYENPTETMHILNFAWDDIDEDGLGERVQNALEETTAYFNH